MAQKTGLLARLFSRSTPKKELCCGVELEEINDAPATAPKPGMNPAAGSAQSSADKDKAAGR